MATEIVCAKCSGVELPDDIRCVDPTPLMLAVYSGHIECIDELLKIKGNRRPPAKKCGKSIILWAIKNCQNKPGEVVKSLVVKGKANLDTALQLAVENQDVESVEYLVDAGANVNKPDRDKVTAIHRTLERRIGRKEETQQRIAEALIQGGADVNRRNLVNDTVLHSAIFARYDSCIRMVLRAEADVNAVNNLGEAAIDLALDRKYPLKPETLALILEAGAAVKKENMFDLFYFACQNITLAEQLLAKGADVNITDRNGRHVLFSASTAKAECIRVFLKQGALVNKTDVNGNNALQHFLQKDGKNGHVAMLLFAAGEKLRRNSEMSQLKKIAPQYKEVLKSRCRLDTICRVAIRKYLLELNSHWNLLIRIPQLPLTAPLRDFLLFNLSSDDSEAEDDDDDIIIIDDSNNDRDVVVIDD